jgi:hypothetical protein
MKVRLLLITGLTIIFCKINGQNKYFDLQIINSKPEISASKNNSNYIALNVQSARIWQLQKNCTNVSDDFNKYQMLNSRSNGNGLIKAGGFVFVVGGLVCVGASFSNQSNYNQRSLVMPGLMLTAIGVLIIKLANE